MSFASSRKLKLRNADLRKGYFQGERLSKPLLLKQPRGGIPEPGIKEDDVLLASLEKSSTGTTKGYAPMIFACYGVRFPELICAVCVGSRQSRFYRF